MEETRAAGQTVVLKPRKQVEEERKRLLSLLHEYRAGLVQLGQFVRALSALFSKIL